MSVNFEFNAPQFVNTSEDPDADRFFDFPHETNSLISTISPVQKSKLECEEDPDIENKDPCPQTNNQKIEDVFPKKIDVESQNKLEEAPSRGEDTVSLENEKNLLESLTNLHIDKPVKNKVKSILSETNVFEGIVLEKPSPKKHTMKTRMDNRLKSYSIQLRNRTVQKLNTSLDLGPTDDAQLGSKARPSVAVKRKASPLSAKKKFVSLAERIQRFHNETPDRFRTIPKNPYVPQVFKVRQTIPKTPILAARFRHRPVNFPNEKEREELELEEIKKNQIKAYPLNEKILKGPVLNLKHPLEKKPSTVPEPFRLSEARKKVQPASPVFVFKAQPLPTTILNRPVGIPPKKVQKATVPTTPNIKMPGRFHSESISSSNKSLNVDTPVSLPRTTKVQPFSFDQSIKEQLRKKAEHIKKVIEEERKAASSFKALPLPSYISKGSSIHGTPVHKDIHNASLSSTCKKDTENKISVTAEHVFKARPALVVHQKPFKPILSKHDWVAPEEVQLNTEKRAKERQKFDEKLKKKEEEYAEILQKQKEEEEKLEKIKIMEERKLTQFKAKPMPKYKPFEIAFSDPSNLTEPHTPKFASSKKH